MSPLKINLNGSLIGKTASDKTDFEVNTLGLSIIWLGDNSGIAFLISSDGTKLAEFNLQRMGDRGEYGFLTSIPPVEAGEPTTEVRWKLGLERF